MLEPAVVVLRLLQYLGAMVLFGSSLFFLYSLPRSGPMSPARHAWTGRLLLIAALLLALTSLLQIAAQSAALAASVTDGLKFEALSAVISFMPQGKAALLRVAAAFLAAIALLALPSGRSRYVPASMLGAIATGSLAWMGHAAATEGTLGTVHRAGDVLHVLAAAVWIGALCGFLGLLSRPSDEPEAHASLHAALAGFAGIGSLVVAVIVATGILNSWVLVGVDRFKVLSTTPYGLLLILKLLLFVLMCGLAAVNRYRLTPAFGRSLIAVSGPDTRALRRSVALETAFGVGVLALVAWFGILEPPVAQ